MQIERVSIQGLFGHLNHSIEFPEVQEESPTTSMALLYGPNGIGKTTILRMIEGILRAREIRVAAFNPISSRDSRGMTLGIFRLVPFRTFTLQLSGIPTLQVTRLVGHTPSTAPGIEVRFGGMTGRASFEPEHRINGYSEDRDLFALRQEFGRLSRELSFELVETARVHRQQDERARRSARNALVGRDVDDGGNETDSLSRSMARFVAEAQINYQEFFTATAPELFPRILERLNDPRADDPDIELLLARLRHVADQDAQTDRLGLERDRWDYGQLEQALGSAVQQPEIRHNALAIMAQYVETLEARAEERRLISNRLFTFENVMNEFFFDKTVRVSQFSGLEIKTKSGTSLTEANLSSGEYNLLYLMVSAVLARRRGTVIAIDEPEMSMHIQWQRKLIPALFECAKNAEPQFILATHSPDLAATYRESLMELSE